MKIADLYFEGRLDDGKLQVDAKKSGDKAGDTLGKSMASKIKQSFSGGELGKGLVQGLGLAGALGGAQLLTKGLEVVTDVIGSSIKAASDLNESMSKSGVVFGNAAKDIEDFANTADTSLGLSKQAALEAAASFGNLFIGTGKSQEQAAALSKSMVTLAGDLASFNNLDPGDALEKLRSGLTGEAEPLRSMGVFLTEAKVKAKAMEMGLGNLRGELSEGDKVLARYQVILDETTTAQGDYARTADGVANTQRTLNAEIENAKAELGQELLPLEKDWLQVQRDSIPVLQTLVENMGLLGDATNFLVDPTQLVINKQKDLTKEEVKRLNAAEKARQADLAAANALNTIGNTLDNVADKGGRAATKLVTGATKIGTAFKQLRRDLLGDAQEIVTGYYDRLILEDNLRATNYEINAQRLIIASKTSTDAQKRDARIALHQLEADQAQMLQDLAEHGASTSKTFTKTLAGLYTKLKNAHGAEKKAIQAEILALQLLAIQANIATNAVGATIAKGGYVSAAGAQAATNHHAAGGPMAAREVSWVGEGGPELWVPDVPGRIISHPQSMALASSGGMGGDTINVNLLDRMEVRSVRDIGAGLRMLGETGNLGRRKR